MESKLSPPPRYERAWKRLPGADKCRIEKGPGQPGPGKQPTRASKSAAILVQSWIGRERRAGAILRCCRCFGYPGDRGLLGVMSALTRSSARRSANENVRLRSHPGVLSIIMIFQQWPNVYPDRCATQHSLRCQPTGKEIVLVEGFERNGDFAPTIRMMHRRLNEGVWACEQIFNRRNKVARLRFINEPSDSVFVDLLPYPGTVHREHHDWHFR